MGPKLTTIAKKNPQMWETILSQHQYIHSMGVQYTDFSEGYTDRYDHGNISMECLDELAKYMVENKINLDN